MASLGLHFKTVGGKNVLMYNGQVIDKLFSNVRNSYGLYINGNRLDFDGGLVAASANAAVLHPASDNVYLNEVSLLESGKCINITLEDYNDLRAGKAVGGYKRFNPSAVYNIVSDISTAQDVTYSVTDGVITFSGGAELDVTDNIVYNNVAGIQDNEIDETETMLNVDCPFVNVRFFNPVVPVGGKINITYYVDTRHLDSLNNSSLGRTFTIVITTESGTVAKKTTYAGEFSIETPAFNTQGETWFSIQCVDSRGIGSSVHYYDILVRDEVAAKFYVMRESDLDKYGISADNKEQVPAYNNKTALSYFFADVKKNGFNGVKMLNRTYWIDYHENLSDEDNVYDFGSQQYWRVDIENKVITSVYPSTLEEVEAAGAWTYSNDRAPVVGDTYDTEDPTRYIVKNTAVSGDDIVFPDEFTVDLNGGKIRAIPCSDVFNGVVVRMNGNFDTHLKNGSIVGVYNEFDFDKAKRMTGKEVAGEGLSVFGMLSCRYCSIDNLDISQSVGYDGCGAFGSYNTNINLTPKVVDIAGKRVDIETGDVIPANGMVVIDKDSSDNLLNVEGRTEVCFGRWGYGGYYIGRQREIFYSFYDAENVYLGTVKSKLYFLCKVPAEAKYMKITGYGSDSDYPLSTDNGGLSIFIDAVLSKNVRIENCNWHDTRTCVITATQSKGILIKNVHFKNIATETSVAHAVTTMVGDFEDGWQWVDNVLFQNCVCERGIGQTLFLVHFCQGFNFINNKGFTLSNSGGIESGFIEDNDLIRYNLSRNNRSFYPFVVYRGNHLGTLNIDYNGSKSNSLNDGEVESKVEMENTTIDVRCLYENLVLKNSTNGNEKVL